MEEETFKGPITKAQIIDWLTTLGLAAIPIIITYQAQIMGIVPPAYTILAVIAFGALSQAASGARVRAAKERVFGIVDDSQEELTKYQHKLEELQRQIDAKQKEVEIVTGLQVEDQEQAA